MHVLCLLASDGYIWTGVEYVGLLEYQYFRGTKHCDLNGYHWVPLGTSENQTPTPSNAVDG